MNRLNEILCLEAGRFCGSDECHSQRLLGARVAQAHLTVIRGYTVHMKQCASYRMKAFVGTCNKETNCGLWR
jgi:hypothetical protein